ncbi:mannitol dehydrogenase family protein [Companilactobacillus baiquanensis]|uniref:Mannitol dehydrogenase family protein n=1 Tax=Companilactobacillus baiquanensis TaxID=2486005 RepID=A0ABW1UVD8_9LACO|nr:mannitol dehydrogenase family protein [Companilactobacillus baiquanensis]
MVSIKDDYLNDEDKFTSHDIEVPKYDFKKVKKETDKNPIWVHFGGGNLFRCFHAKIAQDLLNSGDLKSGIVVAETYDEQVIDDIYQPYNNKMLQVVMKSDDSYQKTLIASVGESIYYNHSNQDGWAKLKNIFENPSLQFVTMSITEKGYILTDMNGELTESAKKDITNDPDEASTNMAAIARLLLARFNAGKYPIAMVSTDNFSENGQRFEKEILTIANGWLDNNLVTKDFIDYLKDDSKVSFPWSMIDRITPNPSEKVSNILSEQGFDDVDILHTDKHTNIAPFGNTEETHYLVIEDNFPNGRPKLENADVIMTDRKTVNDADQMKVTACLNPLHTSLAIFGCLLGYTSIADEMNNSNLVKLIKGLGFDEDLPVVKDPKIIDPTKFINELINKRLPNKNIPDTPQRIASDTSQKIPIRYGVTIQHYLDDENRDVKDLKYIPFILAGWCRYILAVDDQGNSFTPSPDPLLDYVKEIMEPIELGTQDDELIHKTLKPLLSNKQIFAHDLYEIGLADKVEANFKELNNGKEAIAKALSNL